MKYGYIAGIAGSLGLYAEIYLHKFHIVFLGFLLLLVSLGICVYLNIRDNYGKSDVQDKFRESFRSGLSVALVASLLMSFGTFIIFQWVFPSKQASPYQQSVMTLAVTLMLGAFLTFIIGMIYTRSRQP
jgi:hypothetical protein